MTPEEEVIALRAEVAHLRAIAASQATALADAMAERREAMRSQGALEARRVADRERQRQRRLLSQVAREQTASRDHEPALSRDCHVTPPLPPSPSSFPSSFPPSSEPPSSYPLSFPPSSPTLTPISFPPASRSAPEQRDLLPEEKSVKAKKPKAEPPGDPRHKPLTEALAAAKWPHHGGRTAKAISELLAHAERDGFVGDTAPGEVLRRAAIAKASDVFPRVRELHELEDKWGHFDKQPQGTGPPSLTRGSVRAELMDHTKPQEPF